MAKIEESLDNAAAVLHVEDSRSCEHNGMGKVGQDILVEANQLVVELELVDVFN